MSRKMLHFQFLDVAIQIIFFLVTVFVANTFVFLVSGLALFDSLPGIQGSSLYRTAFDESKADVRRTVLFDYKIEAGINLVRVPSFPLFLGLYYGLVSLPIYFW